MDILPNLKNLYSTYFEEAEKLAQNNNPYASMIKWAFGMPHQPGDKTLNPEFYESVAVCLKEFQSQPSTPQETSDVITYVFNASAEHADDPVVGMTLLSIQGLLMPLVPSLLPEQAKKLAGWYSRQYPYRNRFPVQESLLRTLQAKSKQ